MTDEAPKPRRGRPPKVKGQTEAERLAAKHIREYERKAEKRIKALKDALPDRRHWGVADKLRAAYFAGQGRTDAEVATIVGGTTGPRVRVLLHAHGLGIEREGSRRNVTLMRWMRADRQMLVEAAEARDREPEELAALIVRKVLEGGDDAIDALVDRLDVLA